MRQWLSRAVVCIHAADMHLTGSSLVFALDNRVAVAGPLLDIRHIVVNTRCRLVHVVADTCPDIELDQDTGHLVAVVHHLGTLDMRRDNRLGNLQDNLYRNTKD